MLPIVNLERENILEKSIASIGTKKKKKVHFLPKTSYASVPLYRLQKLVMTYQDWIIKNCKERVERLLFL